MTPDFSLISPPIDLKTKDKLLTVASDSDTATLDLRSLQPRVIKRKTQKAKSSHLSQILLSTEELFGTTPDKE